jgi:2',3'-cyclic-nucleotide 2'-phosphodiesterase (5'-nucleotidase family)
VVHLTVTCCCCADFGLPNFHQLISETKFPWLCSNVKLKETGMQLGNGPEYLMFNHNGVSVGVVGARPARMHQ